MEKTKRKLDTTDSCKEGKRKSFETDIDRYKNEIKRNDAMIAELERSK